MDFQELKEKNLPKPPSQSEDQEQSNNLTKLQEQSMKARMEFENTLLKESLETSKLQYEELNKELREILNKTLETSNKVLKEKLEEIMKTYNPVSYTHLRAHETRHDLVCRLLLETT